MNQQTMNQYMHCPVKLPDSVYVTEQTIDGVTVRGVIVLGSKLALIFDTLIFPNKAEELLALCEGREITVVYSHADWDHIWGTCGLLPVVVVAHKECARRFADPEDVAKTLHEYRLQYTEELSPITLIPPTQTFQSNLTLDLGGITVELRHCPGHTKDSIIGIVHEHSLLMGGDCIETPIPLLN
jgi:glyoxylase-like metal-dependent hydrolase (beta-lactamase superfamily II)